MLITALHGEEDIDVYVNYSRRITIRVARTVVRLESSQSQ